MDNITQIQAFLSSEKQLLTSDSYANTNDPIINHLLTFTDSIEDRSRPVRVVIIPSCVFDEDNAPFLFLEKAYDHFLSDAFSSYIPVIFISSEKWSDKQAIPQMRAFRVTDSSIWSYHLFVKDTIKGEYDNTRLAWVLESLFNNYLRGLYNLYAGCEYANLNARLVQQSFLLGSHAPLCPFIFHSEYEMNRTVEEEKEKNDSADCCMNYRWRLLLVDDKSSKSMRAVDEKKSPVNKVDIILPLIKELFPTKNIIQRKYNKPVVGPYDKDLFLLLEYAENLKEAEEAMALRKYDMVLLDYLLSGESDVVKEFGYQLLKHIKDKSISVLPGPCRSQFFLFTSAYVTAVNDRLSAEMLQRDVKDFWHISEGACPTNTPNHFKLLFLRLMDKRLKDSGINMMSGSYVANEIVWKVYGKDGYGTPRTRANKYYQEVLNLLYHYKRILEDVEIPESDSLFQTKGSVLMTCVCQELPQFGGFLEHLCNLVHLTAFGTVRQWPEMWEEYIYFKTQLRDIYNPKGTEVSFGELCDAIEQHIIDLKSSQK